MGREDDLEEPAARLRKPARESPWPDWGEGGGEDVSLRDYGRWDGDIRTHKGDVPLGLRKGAEG